MMKRRETVLRVKGAFDSTEKSAYKVRQGTVLCLASNTVTQGTVLCLASESLKKPLNSRFSL